MSGHFFGDTGVLLGRSLRHILRSPDTIITTIVMPIALLLLFVYVFGGAIESGSGVAYVDYLLPGILLITVASGRSGSLWPWVSGRTQEFSSGWRWPASSFSSR